jgi:hypothetical protein
VSAAPIAAIIPRPYKDRQKFSFACRRGIFPTKNGGIDFMRGLPIFLFIDYTESR